MARILLGVSGGIAAYKAVELVRLATGAGHSVRVIQTPASLHFVGRATFEALRRRGHLVTDAGPWALGRRCAVSRGDGLRAAADPRSGYGGAAAY